MKKAFTLILALLATASTWASDFKAGDLYYNITDEVAKTVEVTYQYRSHLENYSDLPNGVATIPSTVTYNDITYSVTSIGTQAFENCKVLSQVIIPNSVTSIEESAFAYCDALLQITIPNSVTSIGHSAFYGCSNLTQISMSESITSMGEYAFSNCTALSQITIPDNLTTIPKNAFVNCTALTQVTIHNSVTSIGNRAFANCTALPQITIPNSVTSIENSAFTNCSSLTQVTIPNNLATINFDVFSDCSSLSQVTIPNSVTSIRSKAFANCSSLTQVTIGDNLINISNDAFSGCTALSQVTWNAIGCNNFSSSLFPNSPVSELTFGNQVKRIPAYLCYGVSQLESVSIPNNVTNIGVEAFTNTGLYQNDNNWTNNVLYIDNCLIDAKPELSGSYEVVPDTRIIADEAFSGCTALTQIAFPNSLTEIPSNTFAGCTMLSQVTIPNSITFMASNAFAGCSALSQVIWNVTAFPDFTNCEENPFYGNRSHISAFTFGEQVEHIPAYLCYDMSQMTSLTIPSQLKTIGNQAFKGCSALSQIAWNAVNYPDMDRADQRPFADCAITKFTFGDQVKHIPAYLCYDMPQLVSLSIPNSVTTIGREAFGQSGIMSLVLPAGITQIDTDAFKDCNKLNAIVFGGDAAAWCGIDFKNETANPISCASTNVQLYIDNQPVSKLAIPEGVTTIRNYAFNKASFLTFVDIPGSMTAINDSAFANCNALDSIYCRATVPPVIKATTFNETDHSIPLHIPAESFVQYLTADYWNEFTNLQADLTQQQRHTVTYYVAGSHAYFANQVETGGSFQCYVTAAEGESISSITLNGEEIIQQVGADGLLKIENITGDCTLIVTTPADQPSDVSDTQQEAAFRAWQSNGEVFVEHTQEMTGVSLYDVNGRLLDQTKTSGYGVLRMAAPSKIIIVRASYADGTTASRKLM